MREDIHSHPHNTPVPSGFGEDGNCLNYLWRVNEELYLEVNFQGFSREAAEELLLSIALCDLEGLPYTPAPTEEAA